MGKIVVVGCNKGGCSKTTMALNIAVSLANKKKSVCIVDADKQRSLSKWHQDREKNEIEPYIDLVEKLGKIERTLKSIQKNYDYLIVDVAGKNSIELVTSLAAADVLIAPHQSTQFDIDTLDELNDQLERALVINPNLKPYAYLTMLNSNPKCWPQERGEFTEIIEDYENLILLNSASIHRKPWRDSIAYGKSVHEVNCKKSIQEVEALVEEAILNA